MNKIKENILFNIFLIAFCIFLYRFTETVLAKLPFFEGYSFYKFDTILCFLLFVMYILIYRFLAYEKDRKLKSPDFVKAVIMGLGIGGIALFYYQILDFFASFMPTVSESLEEFDDIWKNTGENAVWILLSTAILGPLVEEIMFRGIIFKCSERIMKNTWFPVILSGLLFGLWHEQPVQVIYTAISGLIYGYIYSKKRSLKIPIIIHMVNNFLSSLLDISTNETVLDVISYTPYVFFLPMLFCLFLIIKEKDENTTALSSEDKNMTVL